MRNVSSAAGVETVHVHTHLGSVPQLPDTLVPVYGWGSGMAVGVAWDLPDEAAWMSTGTVHVSGTATDVFGNPVEGVRAVVEVGPLTSVDPTSVKVFAGISADQLAHLVPETVDAQAGVGASRFAVPVTWHLSEISDEDLAEIGVLTVLGTVSDDVTGGSDVTATLYVLVAEASGSQLLDVGCSAHATYTEPGYSVARTCNGDRADKAWSNWRSGGQNVSDTLSYELPEDPVVRSATVHFYKDGSHQSFPAHFQTQYRSPGSDQWVDVGEPIAVPDSGVSPVVEVALGDVAASAVRFVLTARTNTHMIVSEVEFYGPAAGPVSVADLGRLTVNGVDVDGFDPEVNDYSATVVGSQLEVVAVPMDRDADLRMERDGNVFHVTVTASDNTQKVYTLTVTRVVDVQTAAIEGHPERAALLTATATHDPAEAQLSYQWLRDGQPIVGATGDTYTPVFADVGHDVSVSVVAAASGYQDGERTSAPVTVMNRHQGPPAHAGPPSHARPPPHAGAPGHAGPPPHAGPPEHAAIPGKGANGPR